MRPEASALWPWIQSSKFALVESPQGYNLTCLFLSSDVRIEIIKEIRGMEELVKLKFYKASGVRF